MNKESFILFAEHEEIFENLTDKQAGQLIKAIFSYEKNREVPHLDKTVKVAFVPIKQVLDKNREKYRLKCEQNKENGKKGGRPKKSKKTEQNPKKPNGFSEKPKKADNEYEYDYDIKIDDNNKYIIQIGLDKFNSEMLPPKMQQQIILYKQIIMVLYADKREDILRKITINVLSRCWEKMQGKDIDRPIEYLKESVINEVENNG